LSFLESNIGNNPYNDLLRDSILLYAPLSLNKDKIPQRAKDVAEDHLKQFMDIQLKRFESRHAPMVGDAIQHDNGSLTYISMMLGDKFQDSVSGSFHISHSGHCDFSGGFTSNVYKIENLEPVGDWVSRLVWTFPRGHVGANMGIYKTIAARVWKLKPRTLEQLQSIRICDMTQAEKNLVRLEEIEAFTSKGRTT
jgi:hypothetical protein